MIEMKIKIIDLLNKIANGEQVPEKIKYENKIWEYDANSNDYKGEDIWLFEKLFDYIKTIEFINDKVEIIEDSKKIEKMECDVESWFTPSQADIDIIKKVNELIDEINKLKEKD